MWRRSVQIEPTQLMKLGLNKTQMENLGIYARHRML